MKKREGFDYITTKISGERRQEKGKIRWKGQAYLGGGKGESVRVSREGVFRDMTHHAEAVPLRASTLEPTERNLAAYIRHICYMLTNAFVVLIKRSGGWDRGGGWHAAKGISLCYFM